NLQRARSDFSQEGFPVTNAIDANPGSGWAILPQAGQAHWAVFELSTSEAGQGTTTLTFLLDHQSSQEGKNLIGRLRLSVTDTASAGAAFPLPEAVRHILGIANDQRSEAQKQELASYYVSIAPALDPVRKQLLELKQQLAKIPVVTALVMKERASAERP